MKKLKPGYELDLMIAKKLFGMKFPTKREMLSTISAFKMKNMRIGDRYWSRTNTSSPMGFYYAKNKKGQIEFRYEVNRYSVDFDAAFLWIVNFMRKDSFAFKVWQPSVEFRCGVLDGFSRVSFTCPFGPCKKHGNKKKIHHGAYDIEGDTLPLAIVRAALIAKKVIKC